MNRLSIKQRASIVRVLAEGNSIRSTERIVGHSKKAILRLIVELGSACYRYQDQVLRNLKCEQIQCDEIWAFCYSKAKNVPFQKAGELGFGDVWTWTALDPKTKLIITWLLGDRNSETADEFMTDLASRIVGKTQISTDGLKHYIDPVEKAFKKREVSFGQLKKIYGTTPEDNRKRYLRSERTDILGRPNHKYTTTSHIERSNLTLRMCSRRYTRKTNGFSKKLENMKCAVALNFLVYNFARIHQTLQVTPAMAAGISSHLWSLEEVVGLMEGKKIF